ncbi:MAG TPA: C40 family peptidase [Candidatus Corynebacterium gallistercoris]|uniref:C40 family peptidase n=1 Tax=Candidatus Corynebacterium gallistercoris TaxID=2838530 RepID=A0A9D1RZV6_9CORY|nr:C40 family peptidase [Candidatus Corynebacterium gallistercoris]
MSRSAKAVHATLLAVALGTAAPLAFAPAALADPAAQAAPAQPSEKQKLDAEVEALLAAPIPQDVDGLLDHVGRISHAAGATSDEVEQTKVNIGDYQKRLDEANASLEAANKQAEDIAQRLEGTRGEVTNVSLAMYRGANVDPVSTVVGATGPQAAMERTSYLNSISSQTANTLNALDEEIAAAAKARSAASRAKASADFQLRTLNEQKAKLDARNTQLDELKNRVMTVVDGLSPEDRQRWVDRNGPIDVDVDEFLGKLKESAEAAGGSVGNYAGVVAAAMSKLGSPYSWGAAGPDAFDCSGLMLWAYQQQGKTIPRTSGAQIAGGQSVSRANLQPGDIVGFYPGITHVGMYIGDGKIVHASDYGIPVQVVSVDSMPFAGAARY